MGPPRPRSFVAIQFALFDPRPFLVGGSRLPRPPWPLAQPGSDFVRGVGVVRPRLRGTPIPAPGESSFVDADPRLLRVYQGRDSYASRLTKQYVRLYGTEIGYRLDVGFRVYPRTAQTPLDLAELALQTETAEGPLGQLWRTKAFAGRLEASTRPKSTPVGSPLFMHPPLVLVERPTGKRYSSLQATSSVIDGALVPVWQINMSNDLNSSRTQRAALWRLHFESMSLTSMMRLLATHDPAELELDRLLSAIRASAHRLKGGTGSHERKLLAIAKAIRQFDDSLIAHGMAALRDQSRGAARQLDSLLERSNFDRSIRAAEGAKVPLSIHYERTMMGDTIKITNSQVGNFANRSDDVQQVSLSETSLSSPELLDELRDLFRAPEITEDAQASEISRKLIAEVEGPRRFDRARDLWFSLKSVSPVISTLLAAASLTNALFGG